MSIITCLAAICLWEVWIAEQSGQLFGCACFAESSDADGNRVAFADPSIPALPLSPVVPPPPKTIALDPPHPNEVRWAFAHESLPPIVIPPNVIPVSADAPKTSPPVPGVPAVPQVTPLPSQSPPPLLPALPPVPPPTDHRPPSFPMSPHAVPIQDSLPKLPKVPPPGTGTSDLPKNSEAGQPATATPQLPKPREVPSTASQVPVPQPRESSPNVAVSSEPPKATNAPEIPPSGIRQYVILKNRKLIAGQVRIEGDTVIVREGALDRRWSKAEVLGIAEDEQAVWHVLRKQIPDEDLPARMALARWLMFQGLREQALAEARSIVQHDPLHKHAQELIQTLELSLQQFPPQGRVTPQGMGGRMLSDWSQELRLTNQGILSFATQAQPVLANQCMDCHARADYSGPFRLTRVSGFEVGWQHTWQNLRAVATQLNRQEPTQSPLLLKALSAHGMMRQPAFPSRQSPGYKALEAWVLSAVPQPVPPSIPPASDVDIPSLPPSGGQEPGKIPASDSQDSHPRQDKGSPPPGPLPAVPPPPSSR